MKINLSREIILVAIFFSIICYFPIFLHLDALSIRIWDEGWPANYALEMSENNQWFTTYLDGKPDFFYNKPLLLIWLQAICMKLIGQNELAVRLPVAIACLSTVILLLRFSIVNLKNWELGFLAGVFLVCTNGYIEIHVARTGDADGLLVFWITFYSLYYFKFLHLEELEASAQPKRKDFYLLLSAIGVIGAVLTKGLAGLFFIPGLFLYTAWHKKLKILFLSKIFYWSLLLFVIIIGGYYSLREYYNPGYIQLCMEYDFLIYKNINHHYHEFLFYIKNLVDSDYYVAHGFSSSPTGSFLRQEVYHPWLWFLPFAIILGIINKNKIISNLTIFSILLIISDLLILSTSKTKIIWYSAPVFPFIALILAIGCFTILQAIIDYFNFQTRWGKYLSFILLLFGMAFIPYKEMIAKVYFHDNVKQEVHDLEYGNFMRKVMNDSMRSKKITLMHDGWNPSMIFYKQLFSFKGYNIDRKSSDTVFNSEEIVISCQPEIRKQLELRCNVKVLNSENSCSVLKIESERKFKSKTIAFLDFEDIGITKNRQLSNEQSHSGKYSSKINSSVQYSESISISIDSISLPFGSVLRASVWIYCEKESNAIFVCSFENQKNTYQWEGRNINVSSFSKMKWNKIDFYIKSTGENDLHNRLNVYLWNRQGATIYIDDMRLELLETENSI